MTTIETSLHKSYQEGSWGLNEALREIISNAIDGETRYAHLGQGAMTLSYDGRGTVEVRNDGVTVPARALLMGTSESRGDERTIGQFGEGLPMALLVLAREGYPTEIDNGSERWRPVITRSVKFGGEPVLHVETRKLRVDREAFVVKVSGVRPDQWASIRSLFLKLDPAFDEVMTAKVDSNEFNGARVLLQPEFRGRVYNKGVYIMSRKDLLFGYDLHGELNRDRSLMNEYELKGNLNRLLNLAAEADSSFCTRLADMLVMAEDNLEGDDFYADFTYNFSLRVAMESAFKAHYGDEAVAVDSDHHVIAAGQLGKRPIRKRGAVLRMLQARMGSLDDLLAANAKSVIQTYPRSELTDFEQHNLQGVELLLRDSLPTGLFGLEVVDFHGADTEVSQDGETVLLARRMLMDFERSLLLLTSAAVRTHNRRGKDTTTEGRVFSRMVNRLFNSGPDMGSLALHMLAREMA